MDDSNAVEVVERYEISDDDEDDFDYEGIVDEAALGPEGGLGDDDDDDDDDEDFAAALASVRKLDKKSEPSLAATSDARGGGRIAADRVLTQVRPEVVDDFIRNFLVKVGMKRTLDNFNSEWYELQAKGKLAEEYTATVPDIYLRNQDLDERVVSLQAQLDKMRVVTERAQGTWDKFRKERDFHRMHHRRVVQEKAKLTNDLQRLRKHYLSYEPTLKDLQRKYEVAMKEKMLTRLERDRVRARVATLEAQVKQLQEERASAAKTAAPAKPPRSKKGADSRLPPPNAVANPYGLAGRTSSRSSVLRVRTPDATKNHLEERRPIRDDARRERGP